MEILLTFVLSVAAGIAANYICKWLDGLFKAGKHYPLTNQEAPSVLAIPEGLLAAYGEPYGDSSHSLL